MTFYKSILEYINGFEECLPVLPKGIDILQPYLTNEARKISMTFYKKYYSDTSLRSLILGINPGRHGAGLTGIPFTDSKRLKENCKIKTSLQSHETSSEFIYKMIDAYGGAQKFYKSFFISSVSPVGFIKNKNNFNYYDTAALLKTLTPYLEYQMNRLLKLKLKRSKVVCLGEGKNYRTLCNLNKEQNWFEEIIPLAHPRYIMQYQRKQLNRHIDLYLRALEAVC